MSISQIHNREVPNLRYAEVSGVAYLQQHVLLLGNHVHVVLKVVTAKVDGLNQYLLIAIYLSQRGRKGGREREVGRRERRSPLRDASYFVYT